MVYTKRTRTIAFFDRSMFIRSQWSKSEARFTRVVRVGNENGRDEQRSLPPDSDRRIEWMKSGMPIFSPFRGNSLDDCYTPESSDWTPCTRCTCSLESSTREVGVVNHQRWDDEIRFLSSNMASSTSSGSHSREKFLEKNVVFATTTFFHRFSIPDTRNSFLGRRPAASRFDWRKRSIVPLPLPLLPFDGSHPGENSWKSDRFCWMCCRKILFLKDDESANHQRLDQRGRNWFIGRKFLFLLCWKNSHCLNRVIW